MKMTQQRAQELGLITNKTDCLDCINCVTTNNEPWCDAVKTPIKHMGENFICPETDKNRLQQEMTEEEYDAYRHNKLEIIDDTNISENKMSIKEELNKLYQENIAKGMTEDNAYTEAYSVICNKYDDATIDRELDGRHC